MAGELVSPNFLALIRNLKPYLGPRGLQCTELAETLLELLSTEQAQRAQNTFSALRQERQKLSARAAIKADKKAEENSPKGRDPFTLFLILILLVLSTDTNCNKKNKG